MTTLYDLFSAGLYEAWAVLCLAAIVYWTVQGCRWLRGRQP